MSKVEFTVPGDPVPWARARRSGNRYFNPSTMTAYQNKIEAVAIAAGARTLAGPVGLTICAWWRCPKAWHRKRTPFAGGWKSTKPDADNVAKQFGDALEGLCYFNDSQICKLSVQTRWAA